MLRKFAPKGLYLRSLLIIALPVFLLQAVVTYVFFYRHWEEVTASLSANVSGDIAMITDLYLRAAGPINEDDVIELAKNKMDITVRFEEGGQIDDYDKGSIFSVLNNTLDRQLNDALDYPYTYNTSSYPAYVEIRVQLTNGYLVFYALRDRVIASNGHIFIIWMIGASLLLLYIAMTFMRNQIKSILKLAHAAEDFGRGRDAPHYKPSGAREVRQAGRAFIAMRQRIKRHLKQRTDMLAGVSHDLRTPITRMKLALAMMGDDEDIQDLKSDLAEMENMLEEYLNFARTQNAEAVEPVALQPMIKDIAKKIRRSGAYMHYQVEEELTLAARAIGLRRAIDNLVNNAFKHGDKVELKAFEEGEYIFITIEDNGPGIDPALYDEAFKPFSKLDPARNLSQKENQGVGLGLSLVRDVARAHGGDVSLSRSDLGGLCATMRIPV